MLACVNSTRPSVSIFWTTIRIFQTTLSTLPSASKLSALDVTVLKWKSKNQFKPKPWSPPSTLWEAPGTWFTHKHLHPTLTTILPPTSIPRHYIYTPHHTTQPHNHITQPHTTTTYHNLTSWTFTAYENGRLLHLGKKRKKGGSDLC